MTFIGLFLDIALIALLEEAFNSVNSFRTIIDIKRYYRIFNSIMENSMPIPLFIFKMVSTLSFRLLLS
jgi:hypothetical protein